MCSVHTNALRYAKALHMQRFSPSAESLPKREGGSRSFKLHTGKVFLFTVCRTPNGFNVRNQLRYPHPFLLSTEGNYSGSLCGYGFHL